MLAIEAGAVGYVPKSSTANVMLAALRVVLGHGVYLPGHVIAAEALPRRRSSDRQEMPLPDLTPRQMDVLRLILRGMPIKVIARELGISGSTAKAHTSAILHALGVTTRTEAVVEAGRRGLTFGPGARSATPMPQP
jgi:DNA-binding NarL/FixJ family response regulator